MLENLKASPMSAVITHSSPFRLLHSVQEALANLIHRQARPVDTYETLHALPDHLLLDIGVDPRTVDRSLTCLISDDDTIFGRRLSTLTRTTAKS